MEHTGDYKNLLNGINLISKKDVIMERKVFTWKELADKINSMTEEEKNEPVRVWGEDLSLRDNCWLTKDNEDMCQYTDACCEDSCMPRSDIEDEYNYEVVLEAGKYYLDAS